MPFTYCVGIKSSHIVAKGKGFTRRTEISDGIATDYRGWRVTGVLLLIVTTVCVFSVITVPR